MSRRSGVLELAVLGLLHESPLHGYELRKRLNALLGPFRRISYGSLYPCLKDLVAAGCIAEDETAERHRRRQARAQVVYKLTAEGKERLQEQLADARPGRLGGRELRRALRVLRPDRRRCPAADPRRPAHAGSKSGGKACTQRAAPHPRAA